MSRVIKCDICGATQPLGYGTVSHPEKWRKFEVEIPFDTESSEAIEWDICPECVPLDGGDIYWGADIRELFKKWKKR